MRCVISNSRLFLSSLKSRSLSFHELFLLVFLPSFHHSFWLIYHTVAELVLGAVLCYYDCIVFDVNTEQRTVHFIGFRGDYEFYMSSTMDKLVLNCHFRIWIGICRSGHVFLCDSCGLSQVIQSELQVSHFSISANSLHFENMCQFYLCPHEPLASTQPPQVINRIHHLVSIYVHHVP